MSNVKLLNLFDPSKTFDLAVYAVKGAGSFRLAVRDGKAAVEKTERPAGISLEEKEAVRLLTTPEGLLFSSPIPRSWLPLHFHIAETDCF